MIQYDKLHFLFNKNIPQTNAIIIFIIMQPQERRILQPYDFFQQTALPLRLPIPPSQFGDSIDPHDRFPFNFEETFAPIRIPSLTEINIQQCISVRDEFYIEETCPFDDLLSPLRNKPPSSAHTQLQRGGEGGQNQPSLEKLETVITFLAQYSYQARNELQTNFCKLFPDQWQSGIVQTLVGRFAELKKTRQQLVKYCMRKAFKFILELPKNKNLLPCPSKDEKFSFAKSKSRFIKQVSSQKSMNNKFLTQIFSEGDFSQDYRLFLEHFEAIMQEDNMKKVKYLAWLLTHRQEGKQRTLQMVRRMPWTSSLLQKAKKVSFELLKHAPG